MKRCADDTETRLLLWRLFVDTEVDVMLTTGQYNSNVTLIRSERTTEAVTSVIPNHALGGMKLMEFHCLWN